MLETCKINHQNNDITCNVSEFHFADGAHMRKYNFFVSRIIDSYKAIYTYICMVMNTNIHNAINIAYEAI